MHGSKNNRIRRARIRPPESIFEQFVTDPQRAHAVATVHLLIHSLKQHYTTWVPSHATCSKGQYSTFGAVLSTCGTPLRDDELAGCGKAHTKSPSPILLNPVLPVFRMHGTIPCALCCVAILHVHQDAVCLHGAASAALRLSR